MTDQFDTILVNIEDKFVRIQKLGSGSSIFKGGRYRIEDDMVIKFWKESIDEIRKLKQDEAKRGKVARGVMWSEDKDRKTMKQFG